MLQVVKERHACHWFAFNSSCLVGANRCGVSYSVDLIIRAISEMRSVSNETAVMSFTATSPHVQRTANNTTRHTSGTVASAQVRLLIG